LRSAKSLTAACSDRVYPITETGMQSLDGDGVGDRVRAGHRGRPAPDRASVSRPRERGVCRRLPARGGGSTTTTR